MRMIVLLSVVIVLFALAAGGSWYLQSQQAKDPDAPKIEDKPGKNGLAASSTKQGSGVGAGGDAAPKGPVIRMPTSPADSDRLTQLAAALQLQQETLKEREQQIGVREKQMDIVHDEIKKEQKKLEVVRKEVQIELQLLEAKLVELEKRAVEGDKDRKLTAVQKEELKISILEFESQEWKNLKEQVKKLESMDPEAAAQVAINMVDNGKLDLLVKMLSQMRDRQAAAVFAEIARQDAKLPGQIFERMLTLKTPTVAAPK